MNELIAAAVSGAVVGGGVVWWWCGWDIGKLQRVVADQRNYTTDLEYVEDRLKTTLTALRSNCFIPDERGVKVRYSQASVERRVKAETPKEVV